LRNALYKFKTYLLTYLLILRTDGHTDTQVITVTGRKRRAAKYSQDQSG